MLSTRSDGAPRPLPPIELQPASGNGVMAVATGHEASHEVPHEESARAGVYGLLALLLLRPPGEEVLRALSQAENDLVAQGPLPGPLEDAAVALCRAAAAVPADAVAHEYQGLFEAVGAPQVDPYGSRYIAGFLMEKPLAELRGDLRSLGLSRIPGAAVSEDHLGALFEAMRLLIDGQGRLQALPLHAQRDFFARHVEPWAERCLDDIAGAPPANFYRCVARFAQVFLAVERAAFDLLVEEPA